jgi:hypothetical protein
MRRPEEADGRLKQDGMAEVRQETFAGGKWAGLIRNGANQARVEPTFGGRRQHYAIPSICLTESKCK